MKTETKTTPKRTGSLDFYLILATVGVLFALSVICVYGMFYFKFAAIQQLPPLEKMAYMNRTIGVGQGAGNQDVSLVLHGAGMLEGRCR